MDARFEERFKRRAFRSRKVLDPMLSSGLAALESRLQAARTKVPLALLLSSSSGRAQVATTSRHRRVTSRSSTRKRLVASIRCMVMPKHRPVNPNAVSPRTHVGRLISRFGRPACLGTRQCRLDYSIEALETRASETMPNIGQSGLARKTRRAAEHSLDATSRQGQLSPRRGSIRGPCRLPVVDLSTMATPKRRRTAAGEQRWISLADGNEARPAKRQASCRT